MLQRVYQVDEVSASSGEVEVTVKTWGAGGEKDNVAGLGVCACVFEGLFHFFGFSDSAGRVSPGLRVENSGKGRP